MDELPCGYENEKAFISISVAITVEYLLPITCSKSFGFTYINKGKYVLNVFKVYFHTVEKLHRNMFP